MSPSEAPESDEPYCATASFSSAISSALIETLTLRALASNSGDLGVELLADRETLGALFGTVAGQIGALDVGRQVGAGDLHFEAAIFDLDDFAGDGVALLDRTGRL